MKFTYAQILKADSAFQSLGSQRIPVRLSAALARQYLLIEPHLKILQGERKKLIEKHQELDDKTGRKTIKPETLARDNFDRDWLELLDVEVDIEIKEKVTLPDKIPSTCDKCHHNMDRPYEVEPNVLLPLMNFVEAPEPPKS